MLEVLRMTVSLLQLLSSVIAAWKQPQTTWKQMDVDAWQQKFMNASIWISWASSMLWNSPLLWFFSQPFKKRWSQLFLAPRPRTRVHWLYVPMSLCAPSLGDAPSSCVILGKQCLFGHGGFHLVYMLLFIKPISVGGFYWFQFSQEQKCYYINLCYSPPPPKTDILQFLDAHCQAPLL